MDIFKREVELADRQRTPLSVLMIDADNFKQINDAHGHSVGDRVLVRIVDTIRHSLRSYDSIGRYGGEEFLVILPHTGPEAGAKLAERLRAEVEKQEIAVPGVSIRCTVSIGLRSAETDEMNSLRQNLIADADHALLKAKDLGKNRVEHL
jgi:diguanylate cyclase (GGDEF)-like protein